MLVSPQSPLKKGAFRLNVMCKNIYSDPPQLPLKKGVFRLNVMCKSIYSEKDNCRLGNASPPIPIPH